MIKTTKPSTKLLLVITLYYLSLLEFCSLWQLDKTRYAEISRKILVGGDWIVSPFSLPVLP